MLLAQLQSAVKEELDAARKSRNSGGTPLSDGIKLSNDPKKHVYQFRLDPEIVLDEDQPAELRVENDQFSVTLIARQGSAIILDSGRELGQTISLAYLVSDETFLLKRLLEELIAHDTSPESTIRLASQAVGQPAHLSPNPKPILLNDNSVANLRKSLSNCEVTYVWGPPGTGKSTTLGKLLTDLYQAGKRVLILSNTNIAVDTILAKFMDGIDSNIKKSSVIREGKIVIDGPSWQYHKLVSLEFLEESIGEMLRQEMERREQVVANLTEEVSQARSILTSYKQYKHLESSLAVVTQKCESTRNQLSVAVVSSKKLAENIESLKSTLLDLQNRDKLALMFNKRERNHLEVKIAEQTIEHQSGLISISELEKDAIVRNEERRSVITLMESLFPDPPDLGLAELNQHIVDLLDVVIAHKSKIEQLRTQVDRMKEVLLSECQFRFCTAFKAILSTVRLYNYDHIVIDEASMLPPALVFAVCGGHQCSLAVTGDFRQLPPICQSSNETALKWIGTDIFTLAGIPSRVSRDMIPENVFVLRNQYRLNPGLNSIVSETFYGGLLVQSKDLALPGRTPSLGQEEIVIIDTGEIMSSTLRESGRGYSRLNCLHAILVSTLCKYVYSHSPDYDSQVSVGVVTPYSFQAKCVSRLLSDSLPKGCHPVCSTVHRFQGNDRDRIIFDLVDSPGCRLGKFFSASSLDESGAKLLNVAISRSKQQLVLVADIGFMRSRSAGNKIIDGILKSCERHGVTIPVRRLANESDFRWISQFFGTIQASQEEWSNDGGVVATFSARDGLMAASSQVKIGHSTVAFLGDSVVGLNDDEVRWFSGARERVAVVTQSGGVCPSRASNLREMGWVVQETGIRYPKSIVIDDAVYIFAGERDSKVVRVVGHEFAKHFVKSAQPTTKRHSCVTVAGVPILSACRCGGYFQVLRGKFGVYAICDGCGKKLSNL